MKSDSTLIQTRGLKKYLPTPAGMLHAVDSVDLDIKTGTTLGVVGESGCGKSTLGRVVLRLIEPTDGTILFDNKDVIQMGRKEMAQFRQDAAIVFQDPYASLNPRMTVSELIEEPLIVNGVGNSQERQERVFKMMETVGLAARLINAYPHELDGGRRQRIGIARALILGPKFVVCDEPVSALDVSIQAQILNLLMDLQDEMGLTYMFITHDMSVVKHISDEVMVMYRGVCVERAPKKEFFANPLHPYSKGLLASIPKPNLNNRGRKREILRGEVSSPINMPPGCRFANRCKFATEACLKDENVVLRDCGNNHFVACPYAGQVE